HKLIDSNDLDVLYLPKCQERLIRGYNAVGFGRQGRFDDRIVVWICCNKPARDERNRHDARQVQNRSTGEKRVSLRTSEVLDENSREFVENMSRGNQTNARA